MKIIYSKYIMFLLFILLIVLVYLFFNKKLEGFEEDTTVQEKKALICYYGAAFREGNIGSTVTDTKYGYNTQKNTSISHAKLKKVLNEKGYQTDILVNTRKTKYENELESWYDPFSLVINKLSNRIHGRDAMVTSTIESINKINKDEYEFILFVRIDLFLKPEFFDVLDTESDKINFLANNYDPKNCNNYKNNSPKIVDLFIFIPKKYFYILDNNFRINHYSWYELKKIYKLTDDDMTFMTNKMFDSNSYIDKNPYYVMSSRKENTNNNDKVFENKPVTNCPKYKITEQKYIENPTKHYIEKYHDFYMNE